MKIVINNTYGGFSLSLLAMKKYLEIKGEKAYFYKTKVENTKINYEKVDESSEEIFTTCFTKDYGNRFSSKEISEEEWEKYCFNSKDIDRTDKDLITVVEKLGEKANTMCSSLKILEIPDDVDWTIEEYDGVEWVAEKHRTWG